jgi:hypothetical protein
MIFAIVQVIFAPETNAWRKGKEFSVELMNGYVKWTIPLLFKE